MDLAHKRAEPSLRRRGVRGGPHKHPPAPQRGGSKRAVRAARQHNRPASLVLTDAKWTCLPRVCALTISFLEGNTFLGRGPSVFILTGE